MEPKTVLVVDDEADVLKILSLGLEKRGYTVLTADNGPDGIKLAEDLKPNIIILDVMMPDMAGGEVACKLRDLPTTRHIPIVFLTALISKEEEMNRQYVGNNLTLAKPFDLDDLIHIIEREAFAYTTT